MKPTETLLQELGETLPLSFFTASNYEGSGSEFDFSVWQEKETNKAKLKQRFVFDVILETISSTRAERDGEMIGKHNARILNEFQLQNLGDERVLYPVITKATEETLSLLEPTGEEGRPKFELVYIKPSDICKCTCHLMGKKDDRYSNIPLKEKAAWYNKCNHCSVPVSEEDKGVNETP